MSELENRYVKRGYWVNWSQGSVMGQTLTVDASASNIIVALLTVLASIATAQLWNLFAFICHQYRANGQPSDGLFWQHQALLRTLPTPTALVAESIKLSWAWKSRKSHFLFRYSLLILFALCFAIASIAGGISTSYLVDTSNIEVLVQSPFCGRFNYTKMFETRDTSTLLSSLHKTIDAYAQNCYLNSSSLPASCHNIFSRPNIPFTVEAAQCPWESSMCSNGTLPAITVDSGFLDMRTDFGLNIPEKDTIRFRRKSTCNVLPTEGRIFAKNESYSIGLGVEGNRTTLEYGDWRDTAPEFHPEATFSQSTVLIENQPSFGSDSISHYMFYDDMYIGINPLPEMQRNDADVAIMAIYFNDVHYEHPVDDPLFAAHRPWTYLVAGGYPNSTYYKPDVVAGVVGCAIQYQFCIPQAGQDDHCTSIGGSPLDTIVEDFPTASLIQVSLLQLLRAITRLADVTNGADTGSIKASDTIIRGTSPGLPEDQWIKEVIGWEALAWSGYQTLLSAAIIGSKTFDAFADEYTEAPKDAGDKQLCQALKMRKSGGFANVNVFGLSFIIAFSVTMTFLNIVVLRFFIFLSRFRRALAPRIDCWIQGGIFQLQRRAFEGNGQGLWVDLEKEIPLTLERDMLDELPVKSTLQDTTKRPRYNKAKHLGQDDRGSMRMPLRQDTEKTLVAKSDRKEKH